jgi:hypothetical protein
VRNADVLIGARETKSGTGQNLRHGWRAEHDRQRAREHDTAKGNKPWWNTSHPRVVVPETPLI